MELDLGRFANSVASANVLSRNLAKVGFEDAAAVAIRNKSTFDPEEFL